MALVLHGEAGGWDELLIALVAFGVLWIAVKLAGRKPANEDDGAEVHESEPEADPLEPIDTARPPAPNLTNTTKTG